LIESDIEDFLGSLRFERSMAENTCTAYGRDLRFFSKYLARRGRRESSEVTREDIDGYLGSEREAGRKSTTRARRMAAIRMWMKFLKERRYIRSNPAELLDAPKKAKALPKVLSEEETSRILDSVSGKEPRELRDRAMLEVLYGCGLRVSELCALATDDIIANGELLRVMGKGSKERVVPIGRAAGRALSDYLASARDVFTRGDPSAAHLFATRLGRPFTRQAVFKMIRERATAAGIAPERISPHVLRHCFASHMLQHGADIRAIQELLGHADIGTTQVYTHVDVRRFGELHRRFHPRG